MTSISASKVSSFLQLSSQSNGNIVYFQCVGLLKGEVSKVIPGESLQVNQATRPVIDPSLIECRETLDLNELAMKSVVRRSKSRILDLVVQTFYSQHRSIIASLIS